MPDAAHDSEVDSFIIAGDSSDDPDTIIIHDKENERAWIQSDTSCADVVSSPV